MQSILRAGFATLVIVLGSLCFPLHAATSIIPSAPQLAAEGYLLIDASTGHVIVEHNSQQRLPPASLTKMMTSYVASSLIKLGTLKVDDEVFVSEKARYTEGSRMFLEVGSYVPVSDILRGIIIQSGNDASVAIAEHIAGTEDAFVDVMNQHAQHLGMLDTHFMNAHGLPNEDHYSSVADLAKLSQALIYDFPEHYALYSEKAFSYNNIPQKNRNELLFRDKSVDGIKTGHTDAAGYCLVSSALRDGMRLIAVVVGAKSKDARVTASQKLLTYGFRYFETVALYEAEKTLKNVKVWGGEMGSIDLGLTADVSITVPRSTRDALTASLDVQGVIKAPLDAGQVLGTLKIMNGDNQVAEVPLVALRAVAEAGFFSQLWDSLALFFVQLFSGDTLEV